MANEAVELLSCPSCHGTKGKPKLEELADPAGKWRVTCYGCLIQTAAVGSAEEASRIWNTRASLTADEGVEERAKSIAQAAYAAEGPCGKGEPPARHVLRVATRAAIAALQKEPPHE